jgi:N-acetylglucosaminyldiphosphoundecaprenol N-acetyl-beta-D-mannosaminyltransferase
METAGPRSGSPTSSEMLSERLRTERLFGLSFTANTLEEVGTHLLSELIAGRRQLVITANIDHLVRLRHHPELLEAYLAADLVLPDGMPVVWGSRLVGGALPQRVTGVDLMEVLCEGLTHEGKSAFLLGSTDEVLSGAARALTRRFPGIRLAGTHDGFFAPEDESNVIGAINASGADALFVGMGSPKQERWAATHAGILAARLVVCVGGSFDVLAGARSRAPGWMQRTGLEWSYRMVQEPSRLWKRYLIEDAAFVPILAREWRARRSERRRERFA